jgi:GNAT superfamily N-acetyltransferase
VLQNPTCRRKGIGISLIKASLSWGKTNGWKRFEVHQVMPDDPENFETMQKSAVSFWRKLGFDTYRTRIDFNIVKVFAQWEGVAVETEDDAVAFWPDWEEKCLVASMALDLTTWEKK